MQIEVEVFRLIRLSDSPENLLWYKGILFMKTPEGNIPMEISHRHDIWWRKTFNLKKEDIDKLLIN